MGVQFHCGWDHYTDAKRAQVLDKLQAAGVKWVRIDFAWDGVEGAYKGARNAWYIGMMDTCVNLARARGINVLFTLWVTPGWANGFQSNRVPPTNPQDYADFAQWAADHWRGRVAAWEVWNEPDPWQQFFLGTTLQYAQMLNAAYLHGDDEDLLLAWNHYIEICERHTAQRQAIQWWMAKQYAWSGFFADAAEVLSELISRGPDNSDARYLLAEMRWWRDHADCIAWLA